MQEVEGWLDWIHCNVLGENLYQYSLLSLFQNILNIAFCLLARDRGEYSSEENPNAVRPGCVVENEARVEFEPTISIDSEFKKEAKR